MEQKDYPSVIYKTINNRLGIISAYQDNDTINYTEILEKSPINKQPFLEMIMILNLDKLVVKYEFEKNPICKWENKYQCRNMGRRISLKSDYLTLLNEHIIFNNDWKKRMMKYIVTKPFLHICEKLNELLLFHSNESFNNENNIIDENWIRIKSLDRYFKKDICNLACIPNKKNHRISKARFKRFGIDENCYCNSDVSEKIGKIVN